ncbi:MAG: hypothetical protein NZ693_01280 [Thermoflexales bacterium]|nr:hypothetical protein [Thermoflexales bacterium]
MLIYTLVFLLALALALGAVGFTQATYPFWFDQGAFGACGATLLRGGVFLRDCWDVRGPMTPLLYAAGLRLGMWPSAALGFNVVWQALCALALGVLARRMFSSVLAGFVAGVTLWLTMSTLNYWSVAQAEGFANLFFIGAAWCAWEIAQQRDKRALALLGGTLAGSLFWFKYPFLGFGLVMLLWLGLRRASRAQLAVWGAGILLGLGLGLVYFALGGALPELGLHLRYAIANFHDKPLFERIQWLSGLFPVELEAFVRLGSTPTADFKDTIPQVEWLGRGYPFLMAGMALGAGLAIVRRGARPGLGLALIWLLAGLLLCVWQGHFYRYHFVIVLPPMALLVSAGLSSEANRRPPLVQSLVALTVWALFWVGQFATILPWTRDAFTNLLLEGKSLRQIYTESKEWPHLALADFLRDKLAPGEAAAVFSDTPAVYVLADRPHATRFPYLRWADESRDPNVRAALAQLYLEDLRRAPPRLFVLSREGYPWASADSIATWKALPEVNQFVEANYRYVGEVGPYLVFARAEGQANMAR